MQLLPFGTNNMIHQEQALLPFGTNNMIHQEQALETN
jgi:hypothetical protein